MDTRRIGYIDSNEDLLGSEVDLAVTKTMNENFIEYCKLVRRLFAMRDIDVINYSPKKTIYFIEDEY